MTEVSAEVKKYLSEPVYGELPEESYKIRRNLLVTSVIVLFALNAGINVDEGIKFAEITFKNVNELKINIGLLLFNVYFLIHFMLIAAHSFAEWRVRLTGVRRFEPISKWWLHQMEKNEKLWIVSNDVINHIELTNNLDTSNASKLSELKQSTVSLMFYLKHMKVISDEGVFECSLKRFDKWYKMLGNSQNLRWIIIEMAFPIFLGIYTCYLLAAEIIRLSGC